jgi:hypothetical protein
VLGFVKLTEWLLYPLGDIAQETGNFVEPMTDADRPSAIQGFRSMRLDQCDTAQNLSAPWAANDRCEGAASTFRVCVDPNQTSRMHQMEFPSEVQTWVKFLTPQSQPSGFF